MMLEIKNVSKSYDRGKKQALKGFSAQLTSGVYGFLGPNGAGKSTLMNIISDNLAADEGEVRFDGQNTRRMGKAFRGILGYMPQQQGLYDDFTGRRFLWYMSAVKGLKKRQAQERIVELLELVNLKDDANKKLGGYSGGMKQRLLIAQALLNDPKVLILDEPTAGLDPKERIRIRNFISEIAADKIVLLATHVVSDVEFIAKEVMLIKAGELIAKDTTSNLLYSMQGKVFEVYTQTAELTELQTKYRISNLTQEPDGICVRIVGDERPLGRVIEAKPNLEDLYLYQFDG